MGRFFLFPIYIFTKETLNAFLMRDGTVKHPLRHLATLEKLALILKQLLAKIRRGWKGQSISTSFATRNSMTHCNEVERERNQMDENP